MGASESRSCGGDSAFDMGCGLGSPRKDRNAMNGDGSPAQAAVASWIRAREAGDVEGAAKYCHKDFVFASPQLSLAGLEAAKRRLFSQQAPVPVANVEPLQAKANSTAERPIYFRVVSFMVGTQRLTIRQEWVMITSVGEAPLIGSVSASRVSTPA